MNSKVLKYYWIVLQSIIIIQIYIELLMLNWTMPCALQGFYKFFKAWSLLFIFPECKTDNFPVEKKKFNLPS